MIVQLGNKIPISLGLDPITNISITDYSSWLAVFISSSICVLLLVMVSGDPVDPLKHKSDEDHTHIFCNDKTMHFLLHHIHHS